MGIVFLQCATRPRITYNIPPTLPKDKQKELIDVANKGKELYKQNCAECHGIFTKGKDKIPNFTNTQYDNYSSRFLGHDPKNHAVVRQMSMEQLNEVFTFLRLKKNTQSRPCCSETEKCMTIVCY